MGSRPRPEGHVRRGQYGPGVRLLEGDQRAVRGRVPPGVRAMQKRKANISYRFEETERGARVVISTGDRRALRAVHDFLRFQIEDHETGDPKQIVSR